MEKLVDSIIINLQWMIPQVPWHLMHELVVNSIGCIDLEHLPHFAIKAFVDVYEGVEVSG